MRIIRTLLIALLAVAGSAFAQERGTADEAKALLAKAVAHVKAVGAEKALADFSETGGGWQNKDLYVFVVNYKGDTVAHGANKGLIGKNLWELKDPNGKYFVREMVEIGKTKGSGSLDYSFTDPATKKIGNKTSFVDKVPGYDGVMGVGIYKQ